jgi:crotonobetaine/carnitine-CoA ligase
MLSPHDVLRLYRQHDGTACSMLQTRVDVAPGKEFLHFRSASRSYAEVQQHVARTAAMLAAHGVGPGQRVAVMSPNHPSTVVVFLALMRLGAVMVPVNPDCTADEAGYMLAHAEVSGVIAAPDMLATVRAACSAMPALPWLMVNETMQPQAGTDPAPSLDAAVQACTDPAPAPCTDPDATCVFIYTSGTTGTPKAVMHSQRSLLTAGEGFVARMCLQPDDRLLCV